MPGHTTSTSGDFRNPEDTFFRDLCEEAHDLIQSVSPDGGFLYVNRAWRETLGYTGEEIERLQVLDIVHPDSREHCAEAFRDVVGGGRIGQVEAVFVTKDGRPVPVEGSASCRREAGRVVATIGIFRDVSAQRHAKEELARLFDMSLDLLCIAGTDGYFKEINPAFERILGYGREELLSRQWLDFVHPDDREATRQRGSDLAEGRTVFDFENRYRAKDGTWRWLSWRSTALPERGLIYAVARDITDHKRAEEKLARQAAELARSNADLEQFAYAASHDLQAPLRSIQSLADWLREDLSKADAGSARKNLGRLRDQVERMQHLIDDLLLYSRAGRAAEKISRVDVKRLVAEIAELIAPPQGFEIVAGEGLPVFETARSPLDQVLRNLVSNAVRHHDRDRGRVEVSARERKTCYEFSVADDGPGIPGEYHEKIFQMFQKIPSERESHGTGVGLALVKRIVEGMGGAVRVESGEGRGTVFRFTWPRRLEERDADDSDR